MSSTPAALASRLMEVFGAVLLERDVRDADIFESFFLEFCRFSPTSHCPELGVNEGLILMDCVCNLNHGCYQLPNASMHGTYLAPRSNLFRAVDARGVMHQCLFRAVRRLRNEKGASDACALPIVLDGEVARDLILSAAETSLWC